jgi:hypothetical protein
VAHVAASRRSRRVDRGDPAASIAAVFVAFEALGNISVFSGRATFASGLQIGERVTGAT